MTSMMAQWNPDTQSGDSLHFELCKGGYFSKKDKYGLKVVGKTAQNTLTGKNLLNLNDCYLNSAMQSNGGLSKPVVDGDSISCESIYTYHSSAISWKGNLEKGTYTVNGYSKTTSGTTSGVQVKVNGSVIQNLSPSIKNVIFTLEEDSEVDIEFYRPYYMEIGETLTWYNIQLEKGSVITAYEPYCGGIPSPNPDYPQPIQCVKAGTKVQCCDVNNVVSEITVPVDLYKGDIYCPASGKIERYTAKIDSYSEEQITGEYISTTGELDIGATVVYKLSEPIIEQNDDWIQPIFAPSGTVNVLHTPTELSADLSATVLVRR